MDYFSLFVRSMLHIFFPGEATPLLLALAVMGVRHRVLLRTALGLAISNGGVMVVLLLLGAVAGDVASDHMRKAPLYARLLDCGVLLFLSIYFAFQVRRTKDKPYTESTPVRLSFIEKMPLAAGLVFGAVPSFADIQFFSIGPVIMARGGQLWLTVALVWSAVTISFVSVVGKSAPAPPPSWIWKAGRTHLW